MAFIEDILTILEDGNVGVRNVDMFVGTRVAIPILTADAATLSIVETSGTTPVETHNNPMSPAYVQPTAQLMARSKNFLNARTKAQAAYEAIYPIENQLINGTWYVRIKVRQEVFDAGVDERGQSRLGFNIIALKTPAGAIPVPKYDLLEFFGGDRNAFTIPAVADAYPAGLLYSALVPNSSVISLLVIPVGGSVVFEAEARIFDVGGRVKAALFNMNTGLIVPNSELVFSTDQVDGERLRSSALSLTVGVPYGMKVTTNNTALGGAVWGGRLLRTT